MTQPGDLLPSGHIAGPTPSQGIRTGWAWIDPADVERAARFGWKDSKIRGFGHRMRRLALVRRDPQC